MSSFVSSIQAGIPNLTGATGGTVSVGQVQNPFALGDGPSAPSFKSVMADLLNNASQVEALPGELMNRAVTVGDVDVHDVMIANAKADLLLNIATQSTTKIIQAYDRILQIQV